MSLIRFSSLLLLLPAAGFAQNAYVGVSTPSSRVIVNAQVQLNFAFTDIAGTPLDPSTLTWATSDPTVAKVDGQGLVTGIAPGDVSIALSDSNSGASATQTLHIVPGSFRLQATPQQIHAGQTLQLAAAALDAAGNTIPGLKYQYQSAETSIATVDSNGVVTGVAEGFTTMLASIVSASQDPALVTTIQIQVLPAAQYTVKKLISTDATANTNIAAYSMVSATSPGEIASIVTLANGGQAAVLVENGKTTVLAVAGQVLPNARRMVLRLDAVSANSKGDVALLVEYPSQWCNASVILFPHGKPEQELALANCGNGIHSRSLGEDGSVLFRLNNDEIFKVNTAGPPQLLFSLATQPPAKDPVRSVNDFAPSPAGTFILNAVLNSGAHVYLWFDGKQLNQVYRDGDLVRNMVSNSMDLPVGNSDGSFYSRVNGTNFEALVQLAPGPVTTLLMTQDPIPVGKLGWIQNVTDVSTGGILMVCDLNVPSNYHTSVVVWQNNTLMEYAPAAGYASMISGAMLSNGSAITSAVLKSDTGVPALRTISASGATTTVLAAGAPFPQPAPPGIDWHYSARGGSATSLVARGAGDAIMKIDTSVQMLLGLGGMLPNGKTAVSIGGVIANQSGDVFFSASYPTGNGLFRYRAGKFDTVMDNAVTGTGPNGLSFSYGYNYRGRFLAMNDRGDTVSISNYSNNLSSIVLNASDGPHLVAQQNSAAPGGGGFSSFGNIAIDNNGNVMFAATTSDGNTAAYYWNGKTVQRLIGTGDVGPSGYKVNEISNLSGGGNGFVIIVAFGNYALRELRYFDGTQMTTLQSTATSVLDGAGLNYYWMNECTLAGNGDAHCQAQTQDGGNGVYAHVSGGRDLIVARSRDPLPSGEWMTQPLVVGSSANGTVYFTADVVSNGVEALALYMAMPK
jgi:hypothetical protein